MGSTEGLKENAERIILWSTDIPCARLRLSVRLVSALAQPLSSQSQTEFIQVLAISQQGHCCVLMITRG